MPEYKIKAAFSLVWLHTNIERELIDWQWSEFPTEDLYDAFDRYLSYLRTGSDADAIACRVLKVN